MPDDSALIDVNPAATPMVQIEDTHEVDMARAQVYRAAKCAMEIHKMLKMVDNLEGWMQAKITLAADYLEAVSSNLEYDLISATMDTQPTMGMGMGMGIMEAAATKKVDPKMIHALRALSKQFNSAFTKADIGDKKKGEQIDAVANMVADITDRIAHHKTAFSDPAATKLGKMERAVFDHFEPVLHKVLKKEADRNELKKAITASVKKFGVKLVDARKAETKGLPKDVPDDKAAKTDSKKKELSEQMPFSALGGDLKRAAGAVGKAAGAAGQMIKKGVGAVKSAIGQTPPTPDQVYAFLIQKRIPDAYHIGDRLIELNVLPHTLMSASTLGYTPITNRNRWDHMLRVAGVENRVERFNILNNLVKADIAAWMPLVKE